MALVLIKEDGSGRVDANAYADLNDGNAYFDGHLYATAWTAAPTANKEKALVFATRVIDAEYQFYGVLANEGQALQWPRENCPNPDAGSGEVMARDAVPRAIVQATCEMARELLITDRTTAPVGEGIYLQHNADGSETIYSKRDPRPIISRLTQSMLEKLGYRVKKGGWMSRLVRT